MSTSCNTFTIPFQNAATAVIANIKAQVEAQGGTFNGNTQNGQFDVPTPVGQISGTYQINTPQQIDVTITHKPFLLPSCDQIQNYIQDHI